MSIFPTAFGWDKGWFFFVAFLLFGDIYHVLQEYTNNSSGNWYESGNTHKFRQWHLRVWNGTTFAPHTWIDSSKWVLLYEWIETNDLLVQIVKDFDKFPSKLYWAWVDSCTW